MTANLPIGLFLILIPLIFLVAGAYASVGLGGGTGYLAVMTLVGISTAVMTPTALLLNLVVTATALLRFGMAGRLRWKLLLPFLIPAIPAAFLGGILIADREIFLVLLAATLIVASITMFRNAPNAQERSTEPDPLRLFAMAIPAGLMIGFLSGFLGIGGGVFLGPLLLFLGWAGPRQVAAMNSALILVLSSVALAAHGIKGGVNLMVVFPLALAAFLGGLGGVTLAERKLSPRVLQRIFSVIVLIAAIKAAFDAIPR